MQITQGKQQHVFELYGAKFFYRLCTDPEFEDITRSHIKDERTGEVDSYATRRTVAARCIIGWEGVKSGDNGEPVEFDPELIHLLPIDVCTLVAAEAIRHITARRLARVLEAQKTEPPQPSDEELVVGATGPLPESVSPDTSS